MRDECSRGRRLPETPHPYRSDFQRDRDRIIHTRAFRRLEKKTQVFAPDFSDHFRNRLTHTLEVSQISRTVAAALQLNTDLCEVLALSHDIGHPPFSHEGEKVLDGLMRRFGKGFDHNLHALRIVEDFEQKYAAFRGLNLTFEVREGIIKHSKDYRPDDRTYIDISEYRLGDRPPLEAQIIDPAALDAGGRVVFGATVNLEDEETGAAVTYQIVGEDEADLKHGLINISSPIARALIGKEEGDTAEVQAPGGVRRYEVVAVTYV